MFSEGFNNISYLNVSACSSTALIKMSEGSDVIDLKDEHILRDTYTYDTEDVFGNLSFVWLIWYNQ